MKRNSDPKCGCPAFRITLTLGSILLCGILNPVSAENRMIPVELGHEFANATVAAVRKDRVGFLWIGMRQGLVRYDGNDAILYDHDIADPDSLSDNLVRYLYEDPQGQLWLGTNAGGLERFDHATGKFIHHRHDSSDPTTLSHDSVNVMLRDREGVLWVGTQIGLNRMVSGTGEFERIPVTPDDPTALGHPYIYDLFEDEQGYLWIATVGGGLFRRDSKNGTFRRYGHEIRDPEDARRDVIFVVREDSRGTIWVATEKGISRVDRQNGTLVPFESTPATTINLSERLCSGMEIGEDDTLWVGSWGNGLFTLNTSTGETRSIQGGLIPSEERVVAMDLDATGTLWLGTWDSGLQRVEPKEAGFSVMKSDADFSIGDPTSVHVDPQGRLWVGSWGGGVFGGRPGNLPIPPLTANKSTTLRQGTVRSMVSDHQGRLWVGLQNALLRWEPTSPEAVEWTHDPSLPDGIGKGYVIALLAARDGTIWIGVGGGGLHRWRGDDEHLDHFRHDARDQASLSENYITTLFEGHDGTIWVGTRSGGLNALDPETSRFRRFVHDPEDPTSLSHHYVTGIGETDDGTLWVSTGSGGLNRGIRSPDGSMRFERFSEEDGLVDDNIRSLVIEPGQGIWLGTGRGISRFDPETGRFRSYDKIAGLPKMDFNVGASTIGPEAIYLSSSSGIVRIEREIPFVVPEASPTILKDVRSLDRPLSLDQPAWNLNALEVPYGELLTFDFSVLDFGNVSKHRFAYKLGEHRRGWVKLGDRRSITFTNLNPGSYEFQLRGRNAQGIWSETEVPLRLTVVPPLWMTWWFRLFLLLALIGAIFGVHRRKTASLKHRNRALLRLKNQREEALAEARTSRDALHDAYDRLRRLTRRLENSKEDERKRIARELHDEMGQALTAAKINLQLIARDPMRAESPKRIEDAIDLIDEMIEHVRALSLDLRPPLLDQLGLVAALQGYLGMQSQRSGLDIQMPVEAIPEGLPAEVEIAVFRAVQEAITNVIRHAEASRVGVTVETCNGDLKVTVEDNGSGFDVEAALERSLGGQHLGLLGIRERVEGLDGSVSIESGQSAGTKLLVTIPLHG